MRSQYINACHSSNAPGWARHESPNRSDEWQGSRTMARGSRFAAMGSGAPFIDRRVGVMTPVSKHLESVLPANSVVIVAWLISHSLYYEQSGKIRVDQDIFDSATLENLDLGVGTIQLLM